jgi:histidinol dehydrogenase
MLILEGSAAEDYVCTVERRGSRLDAVEPVVRRIVEDVRSNLDCALRKYACQFDGLSPQQGLQVNQVELAKAWRNTSPNLKSALRIAEKNIREFCEWQKPKSWTRSQNGMSLGQVVRPLGSVGCYVPGGRFPLVSTLLMTVIPAQVAGVARIAIVSPRASVRVLAAASMLGIREFYRVGGAQAIAALAYGTDTIPPVDKIVGPGNSYVTAAKKLVGFDCAIDMLAGPTEALIVSHRGNPAFIAADLLAQAEHDPQVLAVFITTSNRLAERVMCEMTHGAERAASNGRARPSVKDNSCHALSSRVALLIARSREQAFEWANRIAPEHITVAKGDLPLVQNAGSIFVDDYSAQAAGDYASGPNHVLPTGGAARFRGGLSVMDFVKVITVQSLSCEGLRRIAPAVVRLAESEGLEAHAESIRVRCASA